MDATIEFCGLPGLPPFSRFDFESRLTTGVWFCILHFEAPQVAAFFVFSIFLLPIVPRTSVSGMLLG